MEILSPRPIRRSGAFVLILTLLSACSVSGSRQPATDGSASPAGAAAVPTRTLVYECADGYGFVARVKGERVWLSTPGRTVALRQVRAASGAKYSDGETTYWSKGEEALLETAAEAHRDCRNDRRDDAQANTELPGADFRAVGNEPGWFLEIAEGGDLLFVTDYGAERYVFPTPEPRIDERAAITTFETRGGPHRLVVTLAGRPCFDSMSGAPFETTVTVRLNDRLYRGCGRVLD